VPRSPFSRVDHLVVGVRDLDRAAGEYTRVLGREPSSHGTHPALGTRNVIFGLANCYLELLTVATASPVHPIAVGLAAFVERTPEGLLAIALGSDALDETACALRAAGLTVGDPTELEIAEDDGRRRRARLLPIAREATRGVNVFAIEHDRAAIPLARPRGSAQASVAAVDHVVLFSDDLTAALAIWRDAFGISERWRREFPDRGTVNVGLRIDDVTIELVAPLGVVAGQRGERLWGVAYTVDDCDAAVARLRADGIPVSDARAGLAPATRVATIKREHGMPTLLIQHTAH
jgi:catechol 2,3-dioxygenase-like lactoylglutathione lyase family enzyme